MDTTNIMYTFIKVIIKLSNNTIITDVINNIFNWIKNGRLLWTEGWESVFLITLFHLNFVDFHDLWVL